MDLGIAGVSVGHWTEAEARTGCTVIRVPTGSTASGEIRGGAPATREFALLDPQRIVPGVDAVVLSGGSAFGLAAADGVAQALEADGVGYQTAHGPVPIVVGMSLYDLGVGDPTVRPDADAGAAALASASPHPEVGQVGAGTGATVGKWRGPDAATAGGLGIASGRADGATVTAVVAVNAAGDIADGDVEAAIHEGAFRWPSDDAAFGHTVIGVVLTDAGLAKSDCLVLAQGAHDGLARAVTPPHMRTDGDAFVAVSVGEVDAPVDLVRLLAVAAVEQAIRGAVATL